MKTNLLTTGLNGLVGSKLAQIYEDTYDFQNLDITHPTHPIDITNAEQVLQVFTDSPAKYVVHFAAYTDVTGAWKQTGDKNGVAYKVNVLGTQNIIKAAEQTGKHVIHISTAYVFNGDKVDLYTEQDQPQPIEWYGQTKYEAEQVVEGSSSPWTILRIDQPFRSDPFPKADIVRRIVQGLKENTLYPQFTNHYFGPTYINDFVKVIDWVIRTGTTGLFHASNGEKWSDYEFAKLINEHFNLGREIKAGDLNEYLKTAQRPYQRNTALDSSRLQQLLDFKMKSIRAAVQDLIE